jgi:plastocyanin
MTRHQTIVKAIAIVVLGSFAFSATSYSFVAGQNVTGTPPAGNATAPGNVTGGNMTAAPNATAPAGNITGDNQTTTAANETGEIQTFNARGQVASTVSEDVLGGRWKIDVIDGEARRVQINITMSKPDGSDFHTLLIDNFTAGGAANVTNATGAAAANETGTNVTALAPNATAPAGNATAPAGNITAPGGNETTTAQAISLSQDGTFEISGTANIYMNDELQWENVPITIKSTGRVLTIEVDNEMTDNHFGGKPIYGFVTALIGDVAGSKESVLPSLEAEAPAAPPGNVTAPGGNATGNMTVPAPAVPPAPTGPTTPNATAQGNVTGGNMTAAPNATAPAGNATGGNQTTTPAPAANQTGGAAGGGGGITEVSIVPGSSTMATGGYDPDPVEISVGDTVRWTNDDSTPHTVTSGGPNAPNKGQEFDSSPNLNPLMAPGDTFEHTFKTAGEFPYYCQLHPNLVGTVIVR